MKFIDNAFQILNGAPELSQSDRESLWDAFHSKNADDLTQHLQGVPMHEDTRAQLLKAKQKPSLELNAVDKVVGAINRMAAMDPQVLEMAESHNAVLKAMLAGSNQ